MSYRLPEIVELKLFTDAVVRDIGEFEFTACGSLI